jgi:hypothetical protein
MKAGRRMSRVDLIICYKVIIILVCWMSEEGMEYTSIDFLSKVPVPAYRFASHPRGTSSSSSPSILT